MLLRPRQTTFIERSLAALDKYKNTLGVAPTGSGKTIMLSGVVGQWVKKNRGTKACVLAHRDELTQQNKAKFLRVNPRLTTSVFDANEKSWQGDTTFAMVQTLSRGNTLKQLPILDLLVIDEAHHAAADSYQKIIDIARKKNPNLALYGVTATPNRGDKKGLVDTFSNVADQITLGELIHAGNLVMPVTHVIDVGTQEELSNVKKTANDFDMNAVSAIMNKTLINDAVLYHWKEKAGDRPTIIFCSTVDHAKNVAATFQKGDINTEVIYGDLTKEERKERLERYESGESQVVVNVDVLTEGYDYTPTSCVVLLRPNSYQGTMIQMVGRGLRTVDPNEYPGVIKTDCIILDFGTSSIIHGKLEQHVNLEGEAAGDDAPQKSCPECDASIPAGCRQCPLCGYGFSPPLETAAANDSRAELGDFVMTEIDLLARSSFKWVDLYHDSTAMMATGFAAWAGAFYLYGHWYAVAGARQQHTRLLSVGERTLCIAACDDWLNLNETEGGAEKSRQWLNETATPQQLKYLPATYTYNFSLTRYHASCLIAFNFNKSNIQRIIFTAAKQKEQVA
ncbi:DEAD/DEAH box helicase [Agarilytica rhodophyticola]|uniref:DEAD/DEAH box helicase n=1 Tax=Agarilytica rhodophyticola TaxID=1737490 RepID=UPI000B340F5B|nr:DEAD/DEAH box helicase [Agarilytica rhodophyticola]